MGNVSIDDNSFVGTSSSHSNDVSDDSSIQQCSTQPDSMTLSTTMNTSKGVCIISGIQVDEDVQDSQAENDFVVETAASHQFNLRSVDLAKLQIIQTEKNNIKKKRLCEKMGLIDEPANKTTTKKIFISKQVNTFKATFGNLVYNGDTSIHIGSTAERKCHVDVTYFYILLPYIKQLSKFCGLYSCTTAIPQINTTTTTTTIPSINTTTAVPSTIDNNTASASSQMRIVSQTNVNGVKSLVITDGNHFFSITTPTNTKTS
ncbi:unnamed protein product [Rotaria magnacalcarata]|uniref:Uncharacterized protein n=1 Tax=Rotaria magnacalcarata TaxID=392030 RepID=A0A8S2LE35_9BILA|nr:unnamed protein product [Rotaria magnacalcarata]CAF3949925.1 unnamed protein product [Rotaria magnacalcarata]CAF4505971.1 unnamed protein product [Rotaria magnacalcarata]